MYMPQHPAYRERKVWQRANGDLDYPQVLSPKYCYPGSTVRLILAHRRTEKGTRTYRVRLENVETREYADTKNSWIQQTAREHALELRYHTGWLQDIGVDVQLPFQEGQAVRIVKTLGRKDLVGQTATVTMSHIEFLSAVVGGMEYYFDFDEVEAQS